MPAGTLRGRIAFEARVDHDDGAGNTQGDWKEQFTLAAEVTARLGGEAVMASRLGGKQPVTLRVRFSSLSAQITTDWRARDTRSGTIYNVRSIADPEEGLRRWLDILCETGVA